MPLKIQVIGLPGTGKTTAIDLIKRRFPEVLHIDFRDFLHNEMAFISAAINSKSMTILESACGIPLPGSTVIRLNQDLRSIIQNNLERGDEVDAEYLGTLEYAMQKPNYTVDSVDELYSLLIELISTSR